MKARTIPPTAIAITVVLILAACGSADDAGPATGGAASITEAEIAEHLAILASDEFGGRAPSSPGEELTVAYLAEQFEAAGLEPANDGSWFQNVPLVDITADPERAPFSVTDGEGTLSFDYADDFVTWTTRVVEASGVEDSDLVFVGYGIVAPEAGWDDYEGVDVTGKTAVILVNDPGFATQDPDVFSGNTMTGPQFNLQSPDGNAGRVAIEGWITEETTRTLFERAGLDFDALAEQAQSGTLRPVEMGLSLTTSVENALRFSESRNVVGMIEGSEAPDEFFVYMAHWDHFGTDEALEAAGEDGIYNGALDNASGTAALLELAEAYAARSEPPRRSILFLAVTAEEQGLLGSKHYAADPVVPLSRTVAGLNMDGLSNFGPTNDLVVIGYGMSELDAIADRSVAGQNRRVVPDPEPEKGYYFRSDHFELAKMGVPMIYPEHGIDHVERGEEYGREMNDRYTSQRYHMVTDEFDDTWDLSGAVPDVQLYYEIGAAVIDSDVWPNWNEGTEFRAIRDESRR